MKFYQEKLANGLSIIGEYNETAVSSALGFFVRTGSRDETPEISGVSHFLEHMMFKGTARRSALELTYEMGSIGAQANAFTSEENTVYYMAVLPEYFEQAMDILCDMLRPALDQHEFDTEKKVILEEIALYQDKPLHVMYEAGLKEYFGEHKAGNSILGTTESVSAISREQMLSYFNQRYSPSNMVLGVAGNFEWPKVLEMANRYCAHWTKYDTARDLTPHAPRLSNKVLSKENLQLSHICYFAPGPSATDERRYAAQVLSMIMGDSTGSRLYWELIDKGLAESASIDADDMDNAGFILGYASCLPEMLDQVAGILKQVMLSAGDFNEADLERAKNKFGTRLVLQAESSLRRLLSVGVDWLYQPRYLSLQDELKIIAELKESDLRELLNSFSFNPVTEVRMIPA
ncbi:MAG: insulinase family protein [Deltaproteobacteria bacterium]|nr:insulinase family protein [Deltaproteobacteria bacterium]